LNAAGENRPGATGGVISGEAGRRARRIRVMLVVALAVVIADQVTKSLAVSRLSSGPIHLIGRSRSSCPTTPASLSASVRA